MNYLTDKEDEFVIINPLLYKYDELDNYQIEDKDDVILSFKTNDLIDSIYYSYESKNKILYQFILDTKRTNIYHNDLNKYISNNYLLRLLKHDHKNIHERKLICFTQSLYYWPFKIIKDKYCNNDLHLGELTKNKKKSIIKYINENNFIFYKDLRLFKITEFGDDETIKIFKIEIHISFDKESTLIIY